MSQKIINPFNEFKFPDNSPYKEKWLDEEDQNKFEKNYNKRLEANIENGRKYGGLAWNNGSNLPKKKKV